MQIDHGYNLLVIVPAYNEGKRIQKLINRIRHAGFHDILLVDDGSSDNTAEIAQKSGIQVARHIINRGPGAATQTGFDIALKNDYEYVATIDGDNQHDPEEIGSLLDKLIESKADMVIGNRFLKGTNYIPQIRNVYNGVANLITFLFAGKWVSDTQSGMKVIRVEILPRIRLKTDGYEFCSEMIIKANKEKLRIVEAPISVYYDKEVRKKGQSFTNGVKTVTNLVQNLFFRY